jgi:hypothetical protein
MDTTDMTGKLWDTFSTLKIIILTHHYTIRRLATNRANNDANTLLEYRQNKVIRYSLATVRA